MTRQWWEDPHPRSREMVVDIKYEAHVESPSLVCPIKLAANELKVTAPPLLGEHSEEILASLLDFDEEQLNRLKSRGVI